jgi:hypothetical protein
MAEAERVALAAWRLLWTLGSQGEHATLHQAPKRQELQRGDGFRHAFIVPHQPSEPACPEPGTSFTPADPRSRGEQRFASRPVPSVFE